MSAVLDFTLPASLEAHEPPEARGLGRDGVRLLVASGAGVAHRRFTELPELLRAGDVLVVNTSGTLAAAVGVLGVPLRLHFSTRLPDGRWAVEVRDASRRPHPGAAGELRLPGGASVTLEEPYTGGRLWAATVRTEVPVPEFLRRHGEPIRYPYVRRRWPLASYQTVFAREPGSAEMPSAGRPFSERVVTRLVAAGVRFAPLVLHTGVASPEAHERPYPEWFAVAETTARLVNDTRAAGGRVIAVGTTAVRALESAAGPDGRVVARSGYTDLIVTPQRGVAAVDGLLTGFHEPRASHLDLLAAVSAPDVLAAAYAEAVREGYLWHEFGDVNLLLP
ncbi:S-adenosylmethionine:tRNA ribosyltransferase-isomerase [Dactylosporangium matsuzakiense]|uniref:S-adenosylmethionine:tRNA ribosyltransferase-isomerase n=1 Tax=Dactylosporangium matsuzakiense TaxID=53360 RepID=A0A9W6KJH1_9ACTN|nr:S-adenosylmethionine:tRNA ribosyltransferase-isomerase [Dactylosporangium matsuzakiense]UWZ46605.1 S-adenosylmethionine:tRNA ribosyltransferase-isomerase [Dactylosporangium matsuzakiense]GLL01265.1 S-adenosylmethionine:tRNA ribosyltransferase-isomerase [Dactylosporangium matsuzakiense]